MGSMKAPGILSGYSGKTLDGPVQVARRLKGASRRNPRFWLPVLFPSILLPSILSMR